MFGKFIAEFSTYLVIAFANKIFSGGRAAWRRGSRGWQLLPVRRYRHCLAWQRLLCGDKSGGFDFDQTLSAAAPCTA
jgi:hypothetical protein